MSPIYGHYMSRTTSFGSAIAGNVPSSYYAHTDDATGPLIRDLGTHQRILVEIPRLQWNHVSTSPAERFFFLERT